MVTRYGLTAKGMEEQAHGRWVRWEDHQVVLQLAREIARKEALASLVLCACPCHVGVEDAARCAGGGPGREMVALIRVVHEVFSGGRTI